MGFLVLRKGQKIGYPRSVLLCGKDQWSNNYCLMVMATVMVVVMVVLMVTVMVVVMVTVRDRVRIMVMVMVMVRARVRVTDNEFPIDGV